MIKSLLLLFFLTISAALYAQHDFFVVKKKGKTLQRFASESFIVFQGYDNQWSSGYITRISGDSFYVHRLALRYSMMGIDTVHFGIVGLTLKEVKTMPRHTAMVFYKNDRPVLIRGHEKFAYIKNGFLFQIAGAGYAALNITNSLIDHKPPFAGKNGIRLGIAAAVFALGQVLHNNYRQHLSMGKKYYLQAVIIHSSD